MQFRSNFIRAFSTIGKNLPVVVCVFLTIILILLPTSFEGNIVYKESDIQVAKVLSVDNTTVINTGLLKAGEQQCQVFILKGKFKANVATARNSLTGSLEQDKIFNVGDKALVRINYDKDTILNVSMIDHYRLHYEMLLALIFASFLVAIAGALGLRAIVSFVLCVLVIWKILVPFYLKGFEPITLGLLITLVLTFLIISLVYGFDRRTICATLGAFLGVLSSVLFSILFTKLLHIHGAIMPNSQSLLYAGYSHLSLTKIFMASIFIGASGAVTDLAVDITSSINEVLKHNRTLSFSQTVASGLCVGRAAMGTMTTTLLLAYSGSYIALLMVFMAQGTPIINILNYKYVASEIVHTIVGSLCLVLTAPFTAFVGGLLLRR